MAQIYSDRYPTVGRQPMTYAPLPTPLYVGNSNMYHLWNYMTNPQVPLQQRIQFQGDSQVVNQGGLCGGLQGTPKEVSDQVMGHVNDLIAAHQRGGGRLCG